jgi:hypothetical protein
MLQFKNVEFGGMKKENIAIFYVMFLYNIDILLFKRTNLVYESVFNEHI